MSSPSGHLFAQRDSRSLTLKVCGGKSRISPRLHRKHTPQAGLPVHVPQGTHRGRNGPSPSLLRLGTECERKHASIVHPAWGRASPGSIATWFSHPHWAVARGRLYHGPPEMGTVARSAMMNNVAPPPSQALCSSVGLWPAPGLLLRPLYYCHPTPHSRL